MASKKLLELMNRGIARELQVPIQYIWQHVTVTGISGAVVEGIFKEIAITEMKNAEEIAERLESLGGSPTVKPDTVVVGNDLEDMLRLEEGVEQETITLYKQTIKVEGDEGDTTTRRLFEKILAEEEEHIDTFGDCLLE